MKILCVIDSLGSGGAQRQLVAIAKGIKERGHDVSFVVYHHEPFFLSDIMDYQIGYNYIQEKNLIKRILKIRKFIRTFNPDGVISFLEAANFISILSGFPFRKWKLVIGERNANPNILNSPKLVFYRWFHFFSDSIVANSYANIILIKKINPLLKDSKMKVIYNSVDINYWKPTKTFCKNQPKFNIIVAASHEYRKNSKGLIEALNLLSMDEKKMLKIDWYGEVREDNESYNESLYLINKYDLNSIIGFHPPTNNILKIIQNADAVGLFSLYEGMPNIICEAMAVGRPILTSAVSDMGVILSNTGNLLFDPSCVEDIRISLSKILKISKEELDFIGISNRRFAKDNFSKEKSINSYINLLS